MSEQTQDQSSSEVFVIAEIGSNHNGDLETAKRMVSWSAEAGAQAAKFQTFSADTLYSTKAPRLTEMANFAGVEDTVTPHQLAKSLEMDRSWHSILAEHCKAEGIEFMSTPFDLDAVDELDPFVSRHKLASFDLDNQPLVERVASKGKPIVLSTGHAYLGEIERSLAWIENVSPGLDVNVLHCTSQYPTKYEDVNLASMQTIASAFGTEVGLSDHSIGIDVSLAAVALGATVLERHVTEDRSNSGPDHHFALQPEDLRALVQGAERIRRSIGSPVKQPTVAEEENRRLARRSIHIIHDLPVGHMVTSDDIALLRPALGILPEHLEITLGRELRVAKTAGEPLRWGDV